MYIFNFTDTPIDVIQLCFGIPFIDISFPLPLLQVPVDLTKMCHEITSDRGFASHLRESNQTTVCPFQIPHFPRVFQFDYTHSPHTPSLYTFSHFPYTPSFCTHLEMTVTFSNFLTLISPPKVDEWLCRVRYMMRYTATKGSDASNPKHWRKGVRV